MTSQLNKNGRKACLFLIPQKWTNFKAATSWELGHRWAKDEDKPCFYINYTPLGYSDLTLHLWAIPDQYHLDRYLKTGTVPVNKPVTKAYSGKP